MELLLTEISKAREGTDWERVRAEVALEYVNIEVPVGCAEVEVRAGDINFRNY